MLTQSSGLKGTLTHLSYTKPRLGRAQMGQDCDRLRLALLPSNSCMVHGPNSHAVPGMLCRAFGRRQPHMDVYVCRYSPARFASILFVRGIVFFSSSGSIFGPRAWVRFGHGSCVRARLRSRSDPGRMYKASMHTVSPPFSMQLHPVQVTLPSCNFFALRAVGPVLCFRQRQCHRVQVLPSFWARGIRFSSSHRIGEFSRRASEWIKGHFMRSRFRLVPSCDHAPYSSSQPPRVSRRTSFQNHLLIMIRVPASAYAHVFPRACVHLPSLTLSSCLR